MSTRPHDGSLLLVSGFPATRRQPREGRAGHTAEALEALFWAASQQSEGLRWSVRQLSPRHSMRAQPREWVLRAAIEQALTGVDRAILVMSASVTTCAGIPALIAGPGWRLYPEERLPLASLGPIVDASVCQTVLLALDLTLAPDEATDMTADRVIESLSCTRDGVLVSAHVSSEPWQLASNLLHGLRGPAVDVQHRGVTLASLADYLAQAIPHVALDSTDASAGLLFVPPPMFALGWDSVLDDPPARPDRATEQDLPPAAILAGGYRLGRKLGEGGFADVYEADQVHVGRTVAVKILRPEMHQRPEDVRLFVGEIASMGQLRHDNLARVYDAGRTDDGRLFLVMERLFGATLHQLLATHGPLVPQRALALMDDVLAGLAAAHDAGIVHADLKPDNVIVVPRDPGDARERAVLVDFGLSRIRMAEQAVDSRGGSARYMAPEQLDRRRVDTRSDVFSAALLLVEMLTGWQRTSHAERHPQLPSVTDEVRGAIERALAEEPAERFAHARAFADALRGQHEGDTDACARLTEHSADRLSPEAPVFRELAAFAEHDRGGFFGRERELAGLLHRLASEPVVMVTGSSGVGKTSLLRAGLMPRLAERGRRAVCLTCRGDLKAALLEGLEGNDHSARVEAADDPAAALEHWLATRPDERIVLIIDQLETVFLRTITSTHVHRQIGLLNALLERAQRSDRQLSLVLAIRADALAHLLAASPDVTGMAPAVLPPLEREDARAAIRGPLAAVRLGISDELLERVLDDLQQAHAGAHLIGAGPRAIYPPHLQLVSSALFQALPHSESVLGVEHYERIGGLHRVIGEYLDRVLEQQLQDRNPVVMHAVFEALISPENQRVTATMDELMACVQRRANERQTDESRDRRELSTLLDRLCSARLLVPITGRSDRLEETRWELVHDSLVAHAVAWLDTRDRARREAKDIMLIHIRRSRGGSVSLLNRHELAQVAAHPRVLEELDSEPQEPASGERAVSARSLWKRSRARLRRRTAALVVACAGAAAAAAFGVDYWLTERSLRDRNVGRFQLRITTFDRDEGGSGSVAVSVATLPRIGWRLYTRDSNTPGEVGVPLTEPRRGSDKAQWVEAPGGRAAFLRVTGRGRAGQRCAASWIPMARLPGYAERGKGDVVTVRVPTCAASKADMVEVPEGLFYAEHPPGEVHVDTFAIERTEVTNRAYDDFLAIRQVTGMAVPVVPSADVVTGLAAPGRPRVYIDWFGARDYCRFMGKELPRDLEWQKAVRGGLYLDRERRRTNSDHRRQVPWDVPFADDSRPPANWLDAGRATTADVGTFEADRSPYGVHDLAGNVREWIADDVPGAVQGFKIVRGGDWGTREAESLHTLASPNSREAHFRDYRTGFRCASRALSEPN